MKLDGREIPQHFSPQNRFPVEMTVSIKKRLPFLLFRLETELPVWLSCEASVTDEGSVTIVFRDSVSPVLRIKLQTNRPLVRVQRAILYLYADFDCWSAFEQKVIDVYRSWARYSL